MLALNEENEVYVAYIVHSMNVGGIERSVARLVNGLDHQRFRPMVVCLTCDGPASRWIESRDVPILEIGKAKTFDFGAIKRLANVVREKGVSIVHSHNWGTLIETHVARHLARVPVHVHAERGTVIGGVEMRGLRMRLRGMAAGWAMKQCNCIVSNSKTVAQRVQDRCGVSTDRITIIPNGVEPHGAPSICHQELKSKLGIPSDAVVVGSVGRLNHVKGFEYVIRSIKEMNDTTPLRMHLVLVGDGPERTKLESLATDLNVAKQVSSVGHQDAISDFLNVFDIYINSSLSEGMSQSLVEALGAGLPLVATDVGDSSNVVGQNEECGILIEPGSVAAIVGAIQSLSLSSNREQIAQRARSKFEREFSLSVMSNRYMDLYDQLMSEKERKVSA